MVHIVRGTLLGVRRRRAHAEISQLLRTRTVVLCVDMRPDRGVEMKNALLLTVVSITYYR